MKHVYNDGGSEGGKRKDCVVRAIAIATEKPYAEIRDQINHLADEVYFDGSDASTGVHKALYKAYLKSLGWLWTPTMRIGSGCTVHLRDGELPMGRLIVSVSRHLVAVIDGVIHDTYDCSRGGKRCVYGYWIKPGSPPTVSQSPEDGIRRYLAGIGARGGRVKSRAKAASSKANGKLGGRPKAK
jgi:hypothetical protein